MKDVIKGYIDFISENKTERECVQAIIRAAREHGYTDLSEAKQLKPGDRVWYNKMGKSIALFQIGTEDIAKGMNILGAHLDSPRLDAKQRPVWEKDGLVYLNTHYYGGIKKYQWLALPLAIHGVVFLTDGSRVDIVIGEKADDPVFCISDILPHIAQDQMKKTAAEFIEGEKLDLVIGSFGEADKGKDVILGLLKDKYGISEDDFMSAELEIVPAGAARESGLDRSCVLGYGQDDRVCSYTSLQALLDTPVSKRTSCCLLVDKEEIGSCGATGMRSRFLDNAVAAVVEKLGAPSEFVVRRALENSMMLSSDVNSAYNPLNWELYDKTNSSFLGRGLVFNKYTGSRGKSNASDANPEFIALVRAQMEKHNVTYQSAEMAKVDVGGGGTIALYAAYYGMQVIDAGVPVLSMHAPWELTNRFDIQQAYEGYCAFLLID